ncbi:MAG: glucokinase [Sulfuricella sp.]|nr:glucokinase [Sulfuricella sp.]
MTIPKTLLAGDIGGTKTLLRLTCGAAVLREQRYDSAAWDGLEPMIADLLANTPVDAACFGVAGPVRGRAAQITNLPWRIDADAIAQQFSIGKVALINDFQAVAYGIEALGPEDLYTLQAGHLSEHGPRAVIGAGTGLGEGYLVWQGENYVALPSEGSHADFAPADELQIDLWRWLSERHDHVSWERVVSGPGLETIYRFLRERGDFPESTLLAQMMQAGDASAAISDFALHQYDPLASAALDLFVAIYGAETGNLALKILASGGVYVAGGIAPKIIERLKNGGFMGAFLAKGRFAELLASIPVQVVLNPEVGLLGAQRVAGKQSS